jgi:hypothetical protein
VKRTLAEELRYMAEFYEREMDVLGKAAAEIERLTSICVGALHGSCDMCKHWLIVPASQPCRSCLYNAGCDSDDSDECIDDNWDLTDGDMWRDGDGNLR